MLVVQAIPLTVKHFSMFFSLSPGKQWINAPNGQLPEIDPFGLGLEKFGINRPRIDARDFTEETEDTEEPEDTEDKEAIQTANSLGCRNSTSIIHTIYIFNP